MKRAENVCKKFTKNNKKSYFQKVTQKGLANNKAFWNTIKPFLTNPIDKTLDMPTVKSIIRMYENHSSIININNKVVKSENRCNIHLATAEQINKIIKELSPKKATGPDKIPPKIVILAANIIDSHLANIINHDLDKFF